MADLLVINWWLFMFMSTSINVRLHSRDNRSEREMLGDEMMEIIHCNFSTATSVNLTPLLPLHTLHLLRGLCGRCLSYFIRYNFSSRRAHALLWCFFFYHFKNLRRVSRSRTCPRLTCDSFTVRGTVSKAAGGTSNCYCGLPPYTAPLWSSSHLLQSPLLPLLHLLLLLSSLPPGAFHEGCVNMWKSIATLCWQLRLGPEMWWWGCRDGVGWGGRWRGG